MPKAALACLVMLASAAAAETPADQTAVAAVAAAAQAATNAAEEPWFREIEITSEPGTSGQNEYSVRFTPGRTHACSKIVFECVYRQLVPRVTPEGERVTRVYEPVRFAYTRPDVRVVNDLDLYVSFRVPVDMTRLEAIYGDRTFNRSCKVSVDRMRISGFEGNRQLWSYELKAEGKHGPEALAAPPSSAPEERDREDESIDDLQIDLIRPKSGR
ncbi:MAG: hypothetical protein FJ225_06115 [Lentisphaerae bacterium]|nr:hypothetical protein [Lentisphaerota bacterium]